MCNCMLCHFPNVDGQIIFSGGPYLLIVYVVWEIFGGHHYVDSKLAYKFFYSTINKNIDWKIVLPSMHQVDIITYFYGQIIRIL